MFDKRKKRTDSCFHQIGSTILNGAYTSFIAGYFLSRCEVSFLYKFGILMMFTILSSLVISMLFYPALCYTIGPQFDEGNITHHVINPLKSWYKRIRQKKE